MNDLKCVFPGRQGILHRLIDPVRALAATHHEQRFYGCFDDKPNSERAAAGSSRSRKLARMGVPVTTHGVLAENVARIRRTRAAPTRASLALSRFALPGMAFDSWINVGHPPQTPGEHRRHRSKSAHAQDRLRIKLPVDLPAPRHALRHAAGKPDEREGKHPWHPDGRQFLEPKLVDVIAHRERVDLFFRDEDQDPMAPLLSKLPRPPALETGARRSLHMRSPRSWERVLRAWG